MNILYAVNPTATSTNTLTLVSGSILNATNGMSVSFTVKNTGDTNSVDYLIVGGNASDLSDGVTVQNSATLAVGAVGSYSSFVAVFSYYGVYLQATIPDSFSTVEILGRTKG